MASQEPLARVQELYVAYYGRPADQAGQEYWADRLEDEDEDESAIINAFGNSAEYDELSEGQGNATLVENLYQQMFGRSADPEGLTYYTGVLESGEKSLAEIATTILNAASGVDQNEFNAKVEAAAEYTAEFGSADDYDIVAAQDVVENAEGGLYTPELTPAIEDYQGAQEAVSDYLQDEVAANETVAAQLEVNSAASDDVITDDEVTTALGEVIDTAKTAVQDNGTYLDDSGSEVSLTLDDNASVAQAQIAAVKEEQAADVADAQEAVAETEGLQGAINSLQSAETRYESALKAEIDTSKALDGEAAKATALNSDVLADGESIVADTDATDNVLASIDDGNNTSDFLVVDNGEVVLESSLTASDYEGLDALIATAQEQYDAEQAVSKQEGSFEEALEKVVNTETDPDTPHDATSGSSNDYEVDTATGEVTTDLTAGGATNSADLVAAQDAQTTFDEAVADYQELSALQDQVDDLNEAVGDAEDAIEEQGVTLQTNTASAEDDLFIFDGEDNAITNFGDSGEDQIYIGDSFTAVNLDLDSGDTLAGTDQGDANTLEVFFSDNGTDTTLSFEGKTFAGNAESGFDGSELTLTGVTADQLSLDNGYVAVA